MDSLNVEYSLVQAKRAYLRFTIKKKCCICNAHIADKVPYPHNPVLRGVSECQCVPPGLRKEGEEHSMPDNQAGLREDLQVLMAWCVMNVCFIQFIISGIRRGKFEIINCCKNAPHVEASIIPRSVEYAQGDRPLPDLLTIPGGTHNLQQPIFANCLLIQIV